MYHVIRSGDTLKKISKAFSALEEEIIRVNSHITDFDKLIPGVKIKIPVVNEHTKTELDYVKPRIEKYYNKDIVKPEIIENEPELKEIKEKEEVKQVKSVKKANYNNESNNSKYKIDYNNIYYDHFTNSYYYKVKT